jgi:Asp-tRNA(Asn)/Glu-tRNA(Gln) amidotransferase A subunit family amidase
MGLSFETNNNIFGRALHPKDPERSTGGSSGGEAGLLATNCSVVGIGSDVGGSIRIPAMFCGVIGLKPMNGRYTSAGELKKPKGAFSHPSLQSSKGPLGI